MNTILIVCLSVCFCVFCVCTVVYLIKYHENELKLYNLESDKINDNVYQLLNDIDLNYLTDYSKKIILKCLHLLNENYVELIDEE